VGAAAGQLSGDEAGAAGGAGSGAAHDADSSVSGDASMEHQAAVVRTSTAGSNSLQVLAQTLPRSNFPQCAHIQTQDRWRLLNWFARRFFRLQGWHCMQAIRDTAGATSTYKSGCEPESMP
jgi:hypothetical protein